jgi:copper chaperone CopZ
MSCDGCGEKVRTALAQTAGVVKVDVKVADKRITVDYDADKLTADKIAKIISDLGYPASAGSLRLRSFAYTRRHAAGLPEPDDSDRVDARGVAAAVVPTRGRRSSTDHCLHPSSDSGTGRTVRQGRHRRHRRAYRRAIGTALGGHRAPTSGIGRAQVDLRDTGCQADSIRRSA